MNILEIKTIKQQLKAHHAEVSARADTLRAMLDSDISNPIEVLLELQGLGLPDSVTNRLANVMQRIVFKQSGFENRLRGLWLEQQEIAEILNSLCELLQEECDV